LCPSVDVSGAAGGHDWSPPAAKTEQLLESVCSPKPKKQ
jgi:hypothetical protein